MTDSINGLPSDLQHLALQENKSEQNRSLGQSEFLELMLTQMQNQDPLNPMESGDFLSQLAQFGTVNGITELQGSFSTLAAQLQSSQALQASTLVGRSVTVSGDRAVHEQGKEFKAAVELDSQVDDLKVFVTDPSGQLIKQLSFGPQAAGSMHFSWDGTNTEGEQVNSGTYQISAIGTADGEEVSFGTLVSASVESVTLARNGGQPLLNLGPAGTVSISDISELF